MAKTQISARNIPRWRCRNASSDVLRNHFGHRKQENVRIKLTLHRNAADDDNCIADEVLMLASSVTDVVGDAVAEYLTHHSPLEAGGKEARG